MTDPIRQYTPVPGVKQVRPFTRRGQTFFRITLDGWQSVRSDFTLSEVREWLAGVR